MFKAIDMHIRNVKRQHEDVGYRSAPGCRVCDEAWPTMEHGEAGAAALKHMKLTGHQTFITTIYARA